MKPVAERCPICRRATVASVRPFCSERCADIDLGRWLDNSYAIPVEDDEEEAGGGALGSGAGQDSLS